MAAQEARFVDKQQMPPPLPSVLYRPYAHVLERKKGTRDGSYLPGRDLAIKSVQFFALEKNPDKGLS